MAPRATHAYGDQQDGGGQVPASAVTALVASLDGSHVDDVVDDDVASVCKTLSTSLSIAMVIP